MDRRARLLFERQGYEDYEELDLVRAYERRVEIRTVDIYRLVNNYFQNIERFEKKYLASDMINSEKKFFLEDLESKDQYELKNAILKQEWEKIIPWIDNILSILRKEIPSNNILRLIAAMNIEFDKLPDYPIALYDIVMTLRTLLMEAQIDSELRNYFSALNKVNRCKEILDIAVNLMEVAKEEGLPVVYKSQIQKIDQVNGKPIYTIKRDS